MLADWCAVVVVVDFFCSLFLLSTLFNRLEFFALCLQTTRFDIIIIIVHPKAPQRRRKTHEPALTTELKNTHPGIAVAFVSLPLHEMRPYQDKRSMTTEKAAAEQHMKDLAEQEKQFKEGKKKK